MTVAARFTAARPWRRSVAVGNEGEMDLEGRGRGAGAKAGVGASGEGSPRGRGIGVLIPSAGTARWCDGDEPLFRPRSGGTGRETAGGGRLGRLG